MNKYCFVIITSLLFLFILGGSCSLNGSEPSLCVLINKPVDKSLYYSDEKIIFSGGSFDKKSGKKLKTELEWTIDKDGSIGNGTDFLAELPLGTHRIVLTDKENNISASCEISVAERTNKEKVSKRMITGVPFSIKTGRGSPGCYGLISTNGTIKNLAIKTGNAKSCTGNRILHSDSLLFTDAAEEKPLFSDVLTHSVANLVPVMQEMPVQELCLNVETDNSSADYLCFSGCGKELKTKDVNSNVDGDVLNAKDVNSSAENNDMSAKVVYSAGDTKTFYVENTANTYYEPHIINAVFVGQTDCLNFWVEESVDTESEYINACMREIESVVLPRLETLWGKCADVNSDGGVTVLFTPTLNDEEVALGFFNPVDFFKRNDDKTSESYNPSSNECDIIYVAVPESYETDKTYNVSAVTATLAHELSHAINFTVKTYNRYLSGDTEAKQMDAFLDEGLSHLTESLIGYGVSGGNSRFISKYLENSGYYSLCGTDAGGNEDSAGRRGGMCLYLYWLFQRCGGMKYSPDGAGFVDNGGISFLRSIVSNDEIGWEAIGKAVSSEQRSTDALFMEFAEDLISKNYDEVFNTNLLDPYTFEAFIPDEELKERDINETSNVVTYSIVKYFNSGGNDIGNCCFTAEKLNGTVFFTY